MILIQYEDQILKISMAYTSETGTIVIIVILCIISTRMMMTYVNPSIEASSVVGFHNLSSINLRLSQLSRDNDDEAHTVSVMK